MTISVKTRKMLWGRSASRCSFPDCRRRLVEDESETDDPSIVGDEAHIVARAEDGPRGDSDLSPEQRDRYDNLILLCKVHHKLVDDQPNIYTVERLKEMKAKHIEWVSENLDIDLARQWDDEVYATYIDKWLELADVDGWESWSSFVLGSGQPHMPVSRFEQLEQLDRYLLSRVWPNGYVELEVSSISF